MIPHKGDMCLLDGVISWDGGSVVAIATSHRRAEHPLRVAGRLPALCGIEYAAQAMALHHGLCEPSEQRLEPGGVLAGVRDVMLNAVDLDEGPGELQVEAIQLAGDQETKIYRFRVMSAGRVLLEGRASVVTRLAGTSMRARMTPASERIAVVIPAFNEAASVADVARRALQQLPWVIVVDDGSRDGTADQLRDLPLTVLRNATNSGKAAALWLGMQHALAGAASAVVTLDADSQHRPEDIPRLLRAHAARPDLIVVAARMHGRAAAPLARRAANRFADFWISWAAGYPIADTQSGFRLYPAAVLATSGVAHDRAHGFVFESEILIEAAWRGVESVAVPVPALYPSIARPSHFRSAIDVARITRMVARRLLQRGMFPQGLLRSMWRRARVA